MRSPLSRSGTTTSPPIFFAVRERFSSFISKKWPSLESLNQTPRSPAGSISVPPPGTPPTTPKPLRGGSGKSLCNDRSWARHKRGRTAQIALMPAQASPAERASFRCRFLAWSVSSTTKGHLRTAATTIESLAKLKHLLRYLAGTKGYVLRIKPTHMLSDWTSSMDIVCYVDSDWAGCSKTRKSTSGSTAQVLGCDVIHTSRTQATVSSIVCR